MQRTGAGGNPHDGPASAAAPLRDSGRGTTAAANGWRLIGGHPALDFVNTVSWRGAPEQRDRLTDAAALSGWCRAAGLLDPARAASVHRLAHRPAEASAALAAAIGLREALHRLFTATSAGESCRPADLRLLNRWLEAGAGRRLASVAGNLCWRSPAMPMPLDAALVQLAHAAAELLASPRARTVRRCAATECGWLFLDPDGAGRRRWCSMADCGNRAKARRHYRRRRSAAPQ